VSVTRTRLPLARSRPLLHLFAHMAEPPGLNGHTSSTSLIGATPRRGNLSRSGVFLFSEVTLSRRRQFHRLSSSPVSFPRAPRPRRTKHIPSGPHKRAIKRAAMRDCGRRCVYCAAALEFDLATLDHVHPLSHGGAHTPGNVVLACARCNRLKGDLLPTEFFARYPWAGLNFIAHARAVHRALKRCARKAVSLALAHAA
jgi:5-methylcytosine-specific restriction endonuclease McrA